MIKKLMLTSLLSAAMLAGTAQAVPISSGDNAALAGRDALNKSFAGPQVFVPTEKMNLVGSEGFRFSEGSFIFGLRHNFDTGGKYDLSPTRHYPTAEQGESVLVPEPATLGLFGLALLMLGLRRTGIR